MGGRLAQAASNKVAPRLSDMEAAVRHARLSRHPMISANALSNLADHWLRASQFSQALALSREALLIPGQQDNSVALGNQGLALMGPVRNPNENRPV